MIGVLAVQYTDYVTVLFLDVADTIPPSLAQLALWTLRPSLVKIEAGFIRSLLPRLFFSKTKHLLRP